jgi:uncharacterized membrane protein
MPEEGACVPDPKVRLLATGSILILFFGMVLCCFLMMPRSEFLTYAGLLIAYTLPGFGKESIIPLAVLLGFPWWQISVSIILADLTLGVIIAYNFDLLLKIPVLGRVLKIFTGKTSEVVQKNPWIKGLSLAGLLIFMCVPFMGSSAINTSIVGRLLSVPPKTLLCIVFAGSIFSTLLLSIGVQTLVELYRQNPVCAILAAAALAVVLYLVWRFWKRFTKKWDDKVR